MVSQLVLACLESLVFYFLAGGKIAGRADRLQVTATHQNPIGGKYRLYNLSTETEESAHPKWCPHVPNDLRMSPKTEVSRSKVP